MDNDEIPPSTAGDPLAAVIAQDLDPLSVEELDHRVAALEREIVRTRGKREAAVNHRATADMLFKS
ncbi:DUF1192 domain-containing protein [Sphingomonas sp. PAMC 26621]|uniref:DUF1192 domain-containing protein n=1 Tax=Sphingomonas sp. PAMC 26621 TaxID=1112213 RepID=UPI0002898892|nr:DUF1192 domain-containing protein [Sphingomonas sp. PAMC 26621]